MAEITIQSLLLQELTLRKTRNGAYSLRAFARDLGVGTTSLSDVMGGKRTLSKSNLDKIMTRLSFSPLERESIIAQHQQGPGRKLDDDRLLMEEDSFRLIADWQYLAVLNLAKIPNNQANPEWIALRLGLKETEAEQVLERLLRLGLIKKSRQRMVRTAKPITTSKDIPSAAIRKHHGQNLQLAEASLHRDPVDKRQFYSMTIAVNPEKLPLVQEVIFKARKKIETLLEVKPVSEVYTFSFQLFPVSVLQFDKTLTESETIRALGSKPRDSFREGKNAVHKKTKKS